MRVVLEGLTKRFGTVTAVNELDLEMRSGEFVALLGPSGCGKTTTLLMVAGLYRPTSGTIIFGDRRVDHLLPKDRGIGMVFQSYALYPHKTGCAKRRGAWRSTSFSIAGQGSSRADSSSASRSRAPS